MGGESYVNTLLTISTPHLGCRLASLLRDNTLLSNHQQIVEPAIRALGVNYDIYLNDFNQGNVRELNKTAVDAPGVNYVSVGGRKLQLRGSESLRVTNELIGDCVTEEYANDGIVGTKEAVWGQHLLNFDADHFEMIGMRANFSAKEMFNFYSNTVKYYDSGFKRNIDI